MGYFSNGTEGGLYEAKYCSRCIHGDNHRGKKDGCPVMLAHVLYAYELCNKKKHPGKHILDLLIPTEGAFNWRLYVMGMRLDDGRVSVFRARRSA